jgi:pimeloyl-ACP methyl ester carboxylesterase
MRTMPAMKSDTLKVPGASLYYEVRGSGPVLLMMPGGPADATTFRKIETDLATRWTVVTYDPRGLSRSAVDEPIDDSRMVQTYADDVHRLLSKVAGDTKSQVFASSGGAVVALELAARYPEQLDTVIVHEPPSPTLQPKPAEVRAAMEHVCDTCAAAGIWPAMQEFLVLVGAQQSGPPPAPQGEPTPEQQEAMAMMQRNMDFFFGRYIRNIARYEPDLDALKKSPCTIVPAIGAESTDGQLARTGSFGLATALGKNVTVFPGDHGGFDVRPAEFAARLLEVLEA